MANAAVYSADGKWSVSGTTATYKVGSDVVAKITGLASGLTAAALNAEAASNTLVTVAAPTGTETVGTITLKQAALGTSAKTVLTLSNNGSYKLALDSGVAALGITNTKLSTSSGKATITGDVSEGHMVTDDKTIIYSTEKNGVTLATVSGLVSSIPNGAVTAPTGTSKDITLSLAAFNKKKVTLSSGYGYKLDLDSSDTEYTAADAANNIKASIGGKDQDAAWSVSGTTATYKQTKTAQYDLASDGKSVAYTAAKTATLATVKGLKKGLTVTSGAISGIETTDSNTDGVADAGSNITLDSTVLGTSKVTLVNGKGLDGTTSTYKLALASGGSNDPATSTDNVQVWAVSGTTATYKTVTPAHYTLDATNQLSVTYDKQKDVAKLATVKGLVKGLKTGTDAAKLYAADGTTEVATASAATSATAASKGTITIQQGALAKNNATITSDVYKFDVPATGATGALTAPQITPTWSVSGTTATLKGTIVAGWEKTSDTQITYTKATATGKYATLATVKGLATGLTNANINNAISVSMDNTNTSIIGKTDGVATITLKAAALGTKNITLSGTGYKLALDPDDIYDATNKPNGKIIQAKATTTGTAPNTTTTYSAPDGKDVWRLDGTTATYKNVTPAYYTPGDTTITYTKEDAEKTTDALKAAAVIATVTGLKSGLTAADNGIYANVDTDDNGTAESTKVVEISGTGETATPYKIQLTEPALTTTPVELTFGKDTTKGVLYLYGTDTATETTTALKVTAPNIKNPAWYVSETNDTSTTAEYRAEADAGWKLNADKNAVNYTPNSSGMVLAKVTGLKGNLTDTTLNSGITVTDSEITLTDAVVGTNNEIAISEGNYTFAKDGSVVMAEAPAATAMWYIDPATPTTAKYQDVTGKYFTYKDGTTDKKTLTYHAPAVAATPNLKATITGLASGLEASGDKIVDAEGKEAIVLASNKLTVYKPALNPDGQTVELDSSTFTFETLDAYDEDDNPDGVIAPEVKYSLTYDADAGTATLSQGTTEGYSIDTDKKKIVYTAFKSSAEDAAPTKIKGLAKGLDEAAVIGTDGTGGYITYDGSAKTITLARAVLGDTAVEFDGTSTYKFAQGTGTFTAEDTVGWDTEAVAAAAGTIATTTAKLYAAKTAAYTFTDTKVTRTAPTIPSKETSALKATITNLKSGLSAVDTAIEGIELVDTDGDDNADVIKLSNNVLAGSTSATATLDGTGYTLALGEDVQSSDAVNTFSIASGTLTYTTTNPAGYALSDSNTKVTYTDEMVDKTTIAGLKSSLNISETEVKVTPDGSNVTLTTGITLTAPVKSTDATVDDTTGTFKIGAKAVGKKDITLTNDVGNSSLVSGDFDYTIALDGVTNNAVNPTVWNKTNKTTTATYTQTFNKGYTQTDDEHIVYASKNTKKTYATLTGINKDVVTNDDGITINGINIAEGTVTQSSAANDTITANVITLSDPNLFTTTNITLGKNDNYYLAVADGFATQNADLHWTYANGTANLVKGTTEGWQIKAPDKSGTTIYDNKTVEYKKANDGTPFAQVTGLNKSLEINDDGTIDGLDFTEASGSSKGTIFIGEAAVEGITGKVELKVGSTSYALAFGDGIGLPEAEEPEWVVSKGTATYQYDTSEGWNLNSEETPTSMTYQAAKTTTLTTITGLNPALEIAGENIEVTEEYYERSEDGTSYGGISGVTKGTITLSDKALEGIKTVKFKEKTAEQHYVFKLADDVPAEGVSGTNLTEDQNADEWKSKDGWVTNGTTATYLQNYNKAHYKFDTTGAIVFVPATKGSETLATLKGIKSGVEITDENGLITLDSTKLDGKNVTLTNSPGYALALDSSDDDIVESKYINKQWTTSGTKATLKGTLTKGYQVSADGKTITYTGSNKNVANIATVAGIKNNVNITDCVNEVNGEITLSKAQLAGTNVTLTNTLNQGYTLKLGTDVDKTIAIDEDSLAWDVNTKGAVATLTGKVTAAGYTVAPDKQSIAYTAKTANNKTTTLATITGINTDIATTALDAATKIDDPTDGTKITLTNEMLGGTATVDGKNLFAFDFADDYSANKTVNGSTASDNLVVNGSGVSVNGGKGNDVIDFNNAGGNTLLYASGDGDDVVVNFTDSDIIHSNKVVITQDNIKTDYSDVLVTIGKNTIRLQNYTGSTLTITDKNGTTTYESQATNPFWTTPTADSASNVLLADNNYSADAAALSDIVEPFKASYTPYDFDGGLDLVKKDSFAPAITFNGTDKK